MSKVLIIGPSWVGDMVMAQTLFILLKQQNEQLQIDVLAPDWSRPLLERMPEVQHAIAMPIGHGSLALWQRYRLAKSLRANNYDQVITLPNSFKSALIPFWTNIKKRTGWIGEYRWGLLNDVRRLDKRKYPLMIQRFMALGLKKNARIEDLNIKPRLKVAQVNVQAALEKFNLDQNKPILALCPGAEFGDAKRWPEQHYAELANEKLAQGWQVWIFGSAKDQTVATTIQTLCQQRCIDLTGNTSLAEATDLLSLARGVVSNDSGLMHIAAALGRPVVVVYGSSSVSFTPPLNDKARMLSLDLACSPCFKRECPLGHGKCLTELQPQLVINALDGLLA